MSLKRSSVNLEEEQSDKAKTDILSASPSSLFNSEAIAKLSVSSQLVNNSNTNKDATSTIDHKGASFPENEFIPDEAVKKQSSQAVRSSKPSVL